ncbi:MAG: hypothetical protein QW575_04725 [Thermoproteota archaeon]
MTRLRFNVDVEINGKAVFSHSSPTDTFRQHIINELLGMASLEQFSTLWFTSGGVAKDSISNLSYQFPKPNQLQLYGSYTPTSSYTLDGMMVTTKNNNTYFVTSISPINVTQGKTVNFTWTVTLDIVNRSPSGMLSKFSLDATSVSCRLLPLILQIFISGRSGASPTGVSLKPNKIEVYGQDSVTVIASSTNITATYDSTTSKVKWITDNFPVTQVSGNNEYIYKIQFVDSQSGCALIYWDWLQYEYISVGDLIHIELDIGV